MTTRQAVEDAEGKPELSRTVCFVCGGTFVSHCEYDTQLIEFPEKVCVWCFSRNDLLDRYMALYEALQLACKQHPAMVSSTPCSCGCHDGSVKHSGPCRCQRPKPCACRACVVAKKARKAYRA